MFIKLYARRGPAAVSRTAAQGRGAAPVRRGASLLGLPAFFLAGYPFRRVGLHVFDDGFDLFQRQVRSGFLLFFWQFIVAQALLDIGSIRPAQELYFFFLEDLDGALFLGFSFLDDHRHRRFERDGIGIEFFAQGVEFTIVGDIRAKAANVD